LNDSCRVLLCSSKKFHDCFLEEVKVDIFLAVLHLIEVLNDVQLDSAFQVFHGPQVDRNLAFGDHPQLVHVNLFEQLAEGVVLLLVIGALLVRHDVFDEFGLVGIFPLELVPDLLHFHESSLVVAIQLLEHSLEGFQIYHFNKLIRGETLRKSCLVKKVVRWLVL